MSVHRQITLKVPLKISAPFLIQAPQVIVEKPSPLLAFASGPRYEAKPLELDLRNLPSADSPEILLENLKVGSAVSEETEDAVSEVSTCSSAVALETVDESESSNRTLTTGHRNNHRAATSFTSGVSPRTTEGSSYQSSSEAEEEDGKKGAVKKSKKISDILGFNAPTFGGNGANEESEEPKTPAERKRKLSITKRISPLSLHGIFTGSQSSSGSKQETGSDKESKKSTTPKATRKLSLTMFHKPSTEKDTRKRRNTDPQLPPKHKSSTSGEDEEKKSDEGGSLGHGNSQVKLVPEKAFFKEEDLKIHGLIQHVLRAHLLSMTDYKREACDRVCKSICNILKTLVTSMKEAEHTQCKVVCQAYVGAVREEGIFASTQSLWDSDKDNFAAASYRHDSLFGIASVVTNQLC